MIHNTNQSVDSSKVTELKKKYENDAIFSISQSHYGHEYVYIFTESQIREAQPSILPDSFADDYYDFVDIFWPMGGSNSSATCITFLGRGDAGINEAYNFLTAEADGPDLEDPELVDLAEYARDVATDEGIAKEILTAFDLKAEELTKIDNRYTELIDKGLPKEAFYAQETKSLRLYENESEIQELIKEVSKER